MHKLFSMMVSITPNVGFPLHFETYGNNASATNEEIKQLKDSSADGMHSYGHDASNLTDPSEYGVSPRDDELFRELLGLHHRPRVPAEIKHEVEKSFRKTRNISVAYNLLALYYAETYEDALKYFLKAIEVTPKLSREGLLDPEDNLKDFPDGIYLNLYFRPMFRAYSGAALCYRRMGKFDKALEIYEHMLHLEPKFRPMQSGYINFRAHIPLCHLYLGDYKKAQRFMDRNADDFTYNSLRCAWLFNYALCLWKRGTYPKDRQDTEWKKLTHQHQHDEHGQPTEDPRIHSLYRVLFSSSDACAALMGLKEMPKVPMCQFISISPGHGRYIPHEPIAIQYQYAKDAMELWQRHPDFLEYMRKYSRTLVAIELATALHLDDKDTQRMLRNYGYTEKTPLREVIDDGIFLNAHSIEEGTLAHMITMRLDSVEDLKYIAQKGFPMDEEFGFGSTLLRPLHQAAYYDKNPEMIKALLEYDNPFYQGNSYSTPANFAANQGNVRVLKTIFEKFPEKATQEVMGELLHALFTSSCYDCIKFGDKCQRCIHANEDNDDEQHSPYCSFEDCVEYLVELGVEYKSRQENFLSARRDNLRKVYMNALEARKKKKILEASRKCHRCGKTVDDAGAKKLKYCGDCREVKYCSRACQIADWPEHKKHCKQIAAESLREKGNDKFKEDKFEEALEFYEKAREKDEKDAKILGNISLCFLQLTRYKDALKTAQECVELDPRFSKGYVRKAQALQKLKQKSAAKKVVRAALKKMPGDVGLKQMAKILGC